MAGADLNRTFLVPDTFLCITAISSPSSASPTSVGVTSNHLFWSVDRQEFVEIGQMDLGERVQTFHGETKRLASKLPRPGPPQEVYNLEVYGEHVYFVGDEQLLAHNNCEFNLNGALLGFKQTHKAIRGYERFGKRYLNRLVDRGLANAEDIRRIRGVSVLQRVAQREADRLSNTPRLLQQSLSTAQTRAVAREGDWLANVFYGSVLEKTFVAKRIRDDRFLNALYGHVGNGGSTSTVDFLGRGMLNGLGFDLTTIGQVAAKRRKYGDGVLVPTYNR